jgi:hypothetical protein
MVDQILLVVMEKLGDGLKLVLQILDFEFISLAGHVEAHVDAGVTAVTTTVAIGDRVPIIIMLSPASVAPSSAVGAAVFLLDVLNLDDLCLGFVRPLPVVVLFQRIESIGSFVVTQVKEG